MHTNTNSSLGKFDTYVRAGEALGILRPALEGIAQRDRALADQMRRAATSVLLNIAEGAGSQAGNRRLRYRTAFGSQHEVLAALHAAHVLGYISETQHAACSAAYNRVGLLLHCLLRTKH